MINRPPSIDLVNIGEASQILGVSEAALRQWTNEGRIKAFITPGGHRRYSKTELKKFIKAHPKPLRMKDLAVQLEDTAPIHREISAAFVNTPSWFTTLDLESRTKFANLSRRFFSLIIEYVTNSSGRDQTIIFVRVIGRDFGSGLAKLGLPLTDSVEAFTVHRNPVISAVTQLLKKREAWASRIVEAIPMIVEVMDEALVSLVAAHQEYRNSSLSKTNGASRK